MTVWARMTAQKCQGPFSSWIYFEGWAYGLIVEYEREESKMSLRFLAETLEE